MTIFDLDGKIITTCAGFDIESINLVTKNRYVVKVSSDFFTPMKVVDSNLAEIVPPIFRSVVWANDKWAYGNEERPRNNGLYSISEKKYYPLPYNYIHEPLNDQSGFIVQKDPRQYDIINKTLKEVVHCQFSSIEQLSDKDLFIIRTFSNNAGLINAQG